MLVQTPFSQYGSILPHEYHSPIRFRPIPLRAAPRVAKATPTLFFFVTPRPHGAVCICCPSNTAFTMLSHMALALSTCVAEVGFEAISMLWETHSAIRLSPFRIRALILASYRGSWPISLGGVRPGSSFCKSLECVHPRPVGFVHHSHSRLGDLVFFLPLGLLPEWAGHPLSLLSSSPSTPLSLFICLSLSFSFSLRVFNYISLFYSLSLFLVLSIHFDCLLFSRFLFN